jgi:hypothetical protein
MKNFFLIASLLFSVSILAQDTSSVSKKQRKPVFKPLKEYAGDSIVPAGRNEIAVNIAPVFTSLLGSSPDNEARFSVFYKRSLKNPRAVLRAGFIYKSQTIAPGTVSSASAYFDVTDSTRTESIFAQEKGDPKQLNFGLEWRSKGGKRWSTYLSFDIIGGIFSNQYTLQNIAQKIDSTGNWVVDNQSVMYSHAKAIYNAPNWYIGGSPNFGVRYAFNKRWVISLQTGVEFKLISAQDYRRDSNVMYPALEKSTAFDLDTPALLNEFAVTFRF